jgi:putative ABC transport system ATP-binding protein
MEIVISNLDKKYNDNYIFKDYNAVIKHNSFNVIYGASGKGKTTLLNVISTLERYNSGNISYYDKDKAIKDKRILRNKYLTYVFQNYGLLENKSVAENLSLALLDKKMTKAKKEEQFKVCLDLVGLSDKLNVKIYSLSGGEQQRVALARCLLRNPDVIIADEPTGNLDDDNKRVIIDILVTLQKEFNKTIIIATHDHLFEEFADNIIFLK